MLLRLMQGLGLKSNLHNFTMTKKNIISTVFIMAFFLISCNNNSTIYKGALIIKGGTIIDLSNQGKSLNDQTEKAVIIKADTIFAIVSLSDISEDQKNVINAKGKYIIPGLTDGFTVINNQSYANAFLYMGVTDVIGVESERRGNFFHNANPGPDVHMLREVGENNTSDEEIIKTIAKHDKEGAEILLMMYKLSPQQVKLAYDEAKKYGMGTIGELGYTTYKEAENIGVDAFVHTTRYSLDTAPDTLRLKVAEEPFSNKLGSPKWRYYQYLTNLDSNNINLINHAENLAASNSFLMPTFSLLYLNMSFSKNPWNEKVASIIDEKDINRPANKMTGKHDYPPEELIAYKKTADAQLLIENVYHKFGAKYLAGSATDVWGTMPGISLHQELEVLKHFGLSNREVLACATSNFNNAFGLKFGKIQKGFKANILILDKNPLDDIRNLKENKILILNGKEINLDSLLTK